MDFPFEPSPEPETLNLNPKPQIQDQRRPSWIALRAGGPKKIWESLGLREKDLGCRVYGFDPDKAESTGTSNGQLYGNWALRGGLQGLGLR